MEFLTKPLRITGVYFLKAQKIPNTFRSYCCTKERIDDAVAEGT